jgi:oxalate decarboxylase/phosphoglucose isomerase-like protein (cupin superfamily)
MFTPIRRIVTGHLPNGKATVLIDDVATNTKHPDDKVMSTLMWVTDQAPSDLLIEEDAGLRVLGTAPPVGGSRFAVLDLLPGNDFHGQHRTDTIDYVICLMGEVDMLLDDEIVHMKSGDVMIQRGTNHAWVNRSSAPARIAFVLIDAFPKRVGSISLNQNAK